MVFRDVTEDGTVRLTGAMPILDDGTPTAELVANFNFPIASNSWLLPHGLHDPAPTIITKDSGGTTIFGDVTYIDDDTARVDWYYPTTGTAVVSI